MASCEAATSATSVRTRNRRHSYPHARAVIALAIGLLKTFYCARLSGGVASEKADDRAAFAGGPSLGKHPGRAATLGVSRILFADREAYYLDGVNSVPAFLLSSGNWKRRCALQRDRCVTGKNEDAAT
jgi:hypothetical protein